MKADPNAIRECLQGDCNEILKHSLHAVEDEWMRPLPCDLDVDAVLRMPMQKINYGRTISEVPETWSVIPRRPEAANARGIIGLFRK